MQEKKFRVVILAAGLGKRMKSQVPKALTPVGGKPILQYLVEAVKVSGLERTPLVVVGRERANLCDAFGETCEYVVQEKQLGTGHAVRVAKEAVGEADALIVLYGDHPFISGKTIQKLAARHLERDNTMTIMTTTIPSFEGWYRAFLQWGRILRGKNGHIVGIPQYRDADEKVRAIKELDPALYCFKTSWLWANIDALKKENVQGEYYLTDMVALAVKQGEKLSSISVAPEEVIGINSQEELAIAEEVLKKRPS